MVNLLSLLIPLAYGFTFDWSISPTPSDVAFTCSKYYCSPGLAKDYDQCGTYNPAEDYFLLKSCNSGEYCIPSSVISDGMYCENYDDKPPLAPAGEYCDHDRECFTYARGKECSDSRCKGQDISDTCIDNFDCNPGFYCGNYNTCTPLKPPGMTCINDYECEAGLLCWYNSDADGICQSALSLNPGDKVYFCDKHYKYKTFLCNSGTCYQEPGSAYGTCTSVLSVASSNFCTSDRDCETTADTFTGKTMYTKCVCADEVEGRGMCQIAPGNDAWSNLRNYIYDWVNSGHMAKCNTEHRFDPWCAYTTSGKDEYEKMLLYYLQAELYPKYKNTPQCIVEVLQPIYSKLSKSHRDRIEYE